MPKNPLIREWQLAFTQTSNCGQYNDLFYGTNNQKLILTSTLLPSGNNLAIYQGNKIEYRLNGDSIIFMGWKKGVYKLTNIWTITGTMIVNGPINGCTFKDQYQ